MDKFQVTKALWDEVRVWANTNGYDFGTVGSGKAPNHPVQTVSWYDAVKWCNARSQKEGRIPAYYTSAAQTTVYRSGQTDVQANWVKWDRGYRLPTEAEWEKAAQGGASGQRFPWSGTNNITHSMANYNSDALSAYDVSPTRGCHPTFAIGGEPYTSPVGYFAANANGYGLYDMAGNVVEWCWDWYGSYASGSQTDPRGPASGSYRVFRGGSWGDDGYYCRAARRDRDIPTAGHSSVGFRSVAQAEALKEAVSDLLRLVDGQGHQAATSASRAGSAHKGGAKGGFAKQHKPAFAAAHSNGKGHTTVISGSRQPAPEPALATASRRSEIPLEGDFTDF